MEEIAYGETAEWNVIRTGHIEEMDRMKGEHRARSWQERHIYDLTARNQVLEQVVAIAESWFEAITMGHFRDIPRRQAILLEVIENYRARHK